MAIEVIQVGGHLRHRAEDLYVEIPKHEAGARSEDWRALIPPVLIRARWSGGETSHEAALALGGDGERGTFEQRVGDETL